MDSFRRQLVVFDKHELEAKKDRLAKLDGSIKFSNALAISLTLICLISGVLIALTVGSIFKKRLQEIAHMASEIALENSDAKIITN